MGMCREIVFPTDAITRFIPARSNQNVLAIRARPGLSHAQISPLHSGARGSRRDAEFCLASRVNKWQLKKGFALTGAVITLARNERRWRDCRISKLAPARALCCPVYYY